jgi:aerobic-type carbon monoxide dehydrogenase small subunit (CoxS/CutS family)
MEGHIPEIAITVNGINHVIRFGTQPGIAKSSDTLADTLRETLLLTGTKTPCNRGACGGCTVLYNGEPRLACSMLTIECNGADIITIEGLHDPETGRLHPIQQAFIDVDAIQCGMCTPGITLAAKALLDSSPNPSRSQICEALAGNICRCTGYEKYVDGILVAAKRIREERGV